jgi:hypothetical protein
MDLVDGHGNVCIAYAAELRVLGLRFGFGGIELYSPSGARAIHRASDVIWSMTSDACEIRGSFADGAFALRHRPTESGWDPGGAPACRGVSWRVLAARASAEAEVRRNGAPRHFSGTGYSDWVALERAPRWLGLSQVEWGRFHLPDGTFVYNRIRTERGATWQRALSIQAGKRVETASVALESDASSFVCRSERIEIALSSSRTLHDGPVLDSERLPSAFERRIGELVTGPARERRLVGRARRTTSPAEDSLGWGIVEAVRFGASAAR